MLSSEGGPRNCPDTPPNPEQHSAARGFEKWWLHAGRYEVTTADTSDDPDARYNQWQQFEHELIDRKISWMLAAQGLLFVAFANLSGDPLVALTVAGTGLTLALLTLFGVRVHQISKYYSWQRYTDSKQGKDPEWGPVTKNTLIGVKLDAAYPLAFAFAWMILIIHLVLQVLTPLLQRLWSLAGLGA